VLVYALELGLDAEMASPLRQSLLDLPDYLYWSALSNDAGMDSRTA
jgi:hypothetical protein